MCAREVLADLPEVLDAMDSVRRSSVFKTITTQYRLPVSGTRTQLSISFVPCCASFLMGYILDSTDYINHKELSDLYRNALDASVEAIAIVEAQTGSYRILHCNQAFKKIFAGSVQQVLNEPLQAVIEKPILLQHIRAVADSGIAAEVASIDVSGSSDAPDPLRFSARIISYPPMSTVPSRLVVTLRQGTLEDRASATSHGKERLHVYMDAIPGVAYRCLNDEHWRMEYIHGKCFALTGRVKN